MATKAVMAVGIIIVVIDYSISRSLGHRSSSAFLSETRPTRKARRPRLIVPMTATTDGSNDNTIVESSAAQQTTAEGTIDDVRAIIDFLRRKYPFAGDDDGIQINNGNDGNSNNSDESHETASGWRTPRRLQRNDDWTKTRNYLYRHNANCRRRRRRLENAAAAVDNASGDNERENIDENYTNDNGSSSSSGSGKKNSRRRQGGPLTVSKIQQIVNFLNITFPNQPELQARVIQYSPRILIQYHSIHSRLLPTVEFLRSLYGSMDQQQHEGVGGDISEKMEAEGGGAAAAGGRLYEAIYRNTDLLLIRGVGYASNSFGGNIGSNINQLNEIGSDDGGGGGNDANALAVEQYLTDNLKLLLSTNEIAILKQNHPTLFQLSLDTKIIPVLDYLRTLLLTSSSKSLSSTSSSSKNNNNNNNNNNSSSKKVQQVLKKIITQHPMLLQLDIDTNLNYTVDYLRDTFDFTNEEVATVISITPGVLGLSVSNNLRPTINFMRDILKVYYNIINDDDDDDNDVTYDNNKEGRVLLRRCVLKHPQILSLSLGNLLAKSEYFDSIDISMMDTMANATARKIKTTTLAARILMTTPSVYSLSLQQNIIPKVNYLSTSIWGMNRTTISNNLYEYPQILTLSMQGNIIPTLSFYNMTGYIKLDTYGLPQQTIESHKQQQQQQQQQQTKVGIRSRYIATSLYNRLLPRWHFLLEERERRQQQQLKHQILSSLEKSTSDLASFQNITTTATTIHLLPSLHLLAGASDGNFCYQMNISLTEYINYKEKEGARLKFTSQFDTWLKTGRPIDLDD